MNEEDGKNTVEAAREEGVSETIKGKDWQNAMTPEPSRNFGMRGILRMTFENWSVCRVSLTVS